MTKENDQLKQSNPTSLISPKASSDVCVSILIKALNEEEKIARCLTAAVREAQLLGGEVILIDSLSNDRTVEIARTFPVRIVQFNNAADRNCGAATQLGYQYALGKYLYLLDGDMELQSGFIAHALEYMENNKTVAGVGGLIVDTRELTLDDKRRADYYSSIDKVLFVDYLNGGGLFRRDAIASVGYLANRWLKAREEADLGMRLLTAGWHLVRLPEPSVTHTGHNESSFEMICRLWRNGRMRACGVFLRSAVGQPWWWSSVRHIWFVFAAPTLYLMAIFFAWLAVNMGINLHHPLLVSLLSTWSLVFLALLWKKKGNATDALLAITTWHLYTIEVAFGFLEKNDPRQIISSSEIK